MKAAFYEKTGAAEDVLRLETLADPSPGRGEVLVAVAVSAVHPSDVKTRSGARGAMTFPRVIPHSDGAGRIVAVGQDVDSNRVGQRVWIWNAAWKRAGGTAADLVALPAQQAVPLPDGVPFEAGACLGIPAITAHRCLFADGRISGQRVLITGGAGTVGSVAIQMAQAAGARVVATVSSDAKADHARAMGADAVVNYREPGVAEAILEAAGGPVDRIVEVEFGGNLGITGQVLAEHGIVAAYGSMAAPEPTIPFYPMMFANQTLRTILAYTIPTAARRQAEADIADGLSAGWLRPPVSEIFPLDRIAAAHASVEAGGRIGVTLVRVASDEAV